MLNAQPTVIPGSQENTGEAVPAQLGPDVEDVKEAHPHHHPAQRVQVNDQVLGARPEVFFRTENL